MSLYRRTFLEITSLATEGISFHREYKHLGYFVIEFDRSHPFQEVNINWLQDEDIGHWRRLRYIKLGKYYFGFYAPPASENSAAMVSSSENVEASDGVSTDAEGCGSTTRDEQSNIEFGRDVLPPRRQFF